MGLFRVNLKLGEGWGWGRGGGRRGWPPKHIHSGLLHNPSCLPILTIEGWVGGSKYSPPSLTSTARLTSTLLSNLQMIKLQLVLLISDLLRICTLCPSASLPTKDCQCQINFIPSTFGCWYFSHSPHHSDLPFRLTPLLIHFRSGRATYTNLMAR